MFNVTNPALERSWYLPAKRHKSCSGTILALFHVTNLPLERPGTCLTSQMLPQKDPGPAPRRKSCPETILDVFHVTNPASDRSWYLFHVAGATQCSCNASGRCNCCFWGHAALLQRSLSKNVSDPRSQSRPLRFLYVSVAAPSSCSTSQILFNATNPAAERSWPCFTS